jgi:hypothetical protein
MTPSTKVALQSQLGEVKMSISGQMYDHAHAELRKFLEEGNKRWLGHLSPIHLLLGVAQEMAKEDVERGWKDYWLETLQGYMNDYQEYLAEEAREKKSASMSRSWGEVKMNKWSELFPDGRQIFYEGNHPAGFVAEIKARFGFDPSENNPRWNRKSGFSFLCPGPLMDDIYGGEYPMGS